MKSGIHSKILTVCRKREGSCWDPAEAAFNQHQAAYEWVCEVPARSGPLVTITVSDITTGHLQNCKVAGLPPHLVLSPLLF